tara:strand:+ start:2174 stop:2929 length:756 start_codon:yes stop_codon:yes gene_type:complete
MKEHVKKILVTGGASGIGAAICRRMSDSNSHFLVHTRANKAGLEKTIRDIEKNGGRAKAEFADLALKGAARLLIQRATECLGGLDVLVANAGYALKTPITDVSDEDFETAHATIARSFFELATAAIPHLEKSNCGRIVGISAFGPHVWRTKVTPFAATAAAKASMEITAKALALQLAPRGITVNLIAPGFVRKDQKAHVAISPKTLKKLLAEVPMGRVGEPEEIASAVAFFASNEASYITGQVIHVNGGLV